MASTSASTSTPKGDDQEKNQTRASTSASTPKSDDQEKKMLRLRTQDGEIFEVGEAVAMQLQTISHMVEDGCADGIVPVSNVDSKTLVKVLEYCKKHHEEKDDETKLEEFDAKYMDIGQEPLYHLFLAANYLNIKGLLDACAQKVANMIKGKMPDQIRETFNIKNDLAPEEVDRIKKQNAWAFE